MRKIPTLFKRDQETRKVIPEVTPGCEWVLAGEGQITEKLDGTNVRLTVRRGEVVRVEKRRNPSRPQKQRGILTPWYVDADDADPANKHILHAVRRTDVMEWPDGEHCCEAIGPKIQGDPLGVGAPVCVPFLLCPPAVCFLPEEPLNFTSLRDYVRSLTTARAFADRYAHAEGVVWHHPDGRMAKLKRKDFA